MKVDIRGAIHNRSFDGFRHDNGVPMTRREALDALLDEFRKGHDYLPVGDCGDFDPKSGCRGHEEPAA